MRLRRSAVDRPGLGRVRRGSGFSYVDRSGDRASTADRDRTLHLAIPPAWTDVWICPYPNGHIQATGVDDAGRRQYLYHEQWHETRAREKHERVLTLARKMPAVRRELAQRLRGTELDRDRVSAAALRMLDAGLFRTGGEEYENDNGSHGVATLLREHVVINDDVACFDFPAKSGVERRAELADDLLLPVIAALKRRRTGDRLLAFREKNGWHDLGSAELNVAFKELVGPEFTVKDLRTWAATVTAAVALAQPEAVAAAVDGSKAARSRAERAAMTVVAEHLGNTPAVARRSYVDPRLIDEYEAGRTIATRLNRLTAADRRRLSAGDLFSVRDRDAVERAVIRLLGRDVRS